MAVFSLDRIELGYCIHCGAATVVGTLRLRPWRHAVSVCASCLRGLGALIEVVSVSVVEGTYGQHAPSSAS